MNRKKYVLDSFAILAVVEDEPGAETVAGLVTGDESDLYLSTISLGEIYYIVYRKKGEQAAEEVVNNTISEDSLNLLDVPWPRVKDAAVIKARGGLSYADAFILALGRELKAPVVTGDPEIRLAAAGLNIDIVWVGNGTAP